MNPEMIIWAFIGFNFAALPIFLILRPKQNYLKVCLIANGIYLGLFEFVEQVLFTQYCLFDRVIDGRSKIFGPTWFVITALLNCLFVVLYKKRIKIFFTKNTFICLAISLSLISTAVWLLQGYITFEQLLYQVVAPMEGADYGIVWSFLLTIPLKILSVFCIFIICKNTSASYHKKTSIIIKYVIYILTLFSAILFIDALNIKSFFTSNLSKPSNFYEENYIDPKTVEFNFPEKKRNLIVIFAESLETGDIGDSISGEWIPEIVQLAKNNINFSNTLGIGGDYQVTGTNWTIAGIVAGNMGLPLTMSVGKNIYGKIYKKLLQNAIGIPDILQSNGYINFAIMGSNDDFSGKDKFYSHGNTTVYDYLYFRNNDYLPSKTYYEFWGFEDSKLYEYSKQKISEISNINSPFFITVETINTHPRDGYLEKSAANKYQKKYHNVLADASKQLNDFILWLKEQPFYENTTVVIIGDHLFMGSADLNLKDRHAINIFINSKLNDRYTKNRVFSRFDLMPILLHSIGVNFNANGLALGRNIDEGEKSLLESMGIDEFDAELQKKSILYKSFWETKSETTSATSITK